MCCCIMFACEEVKKINNQQGKYFVGRMVLPLVDGSINHVPGEKRQVWHKEGNNSIISIGEGGIPQEYVEEEKVQG